MRVAPAFLRINNIMLFFCLLSLECYIEKDERMAWKQRKTGRRFAYTERKLRKNEESNRQKNIPITIVLACK